MSEPTRRRPLTYRDAGVDIDAGNDLVERIKPFAKSTMRPEVMGGLGGFGALFDLGATRYREPVLVSGTDGVGTKLLLARRLGRHDTIGIDLVAMCANDVVVQGAEPLFFLDYFGCGELDVDVAAEVIQGVAEGCRRAGCALVGGETAEMPGMYGPGEYDIVGFCVGAAEKGELIDGSGIREGHALIGVASSGMHSNGYSLVRRILDEVGTDLEQPCGDTTLGEALLAPTRIYVKPVLELISRFEIAGLAHITGGGLLDNVIRVVPEELGVRFERNSWREPPVFDWLRQQGNLEEREMLRTFNCGVGLVVIAHPDEAQPLRRALDDRDLENRIIGEVVSVADGQARVTVA